MSRIFLLLPLLLGFACQSVDTRHEAETQSADAESAAFHVAGMMKTKSGAT